MAAEHGREERCPDCQAPLGATHQAGCDWARCLATGGQRLMCELDDGGPGHDCGQDVWTGELPDLTGAPASPDLVVAAAAGGWTPSAADLEQLVRGDAAKTRPPGPAPAEAGPEPTQEETAVQDRPPSTADGGRRPPSTEVMEAPRYAPAVVENTARPPASSRAWQAAIGELPSPWAVPPETPAALVRYARDADWCAEESTFWRFLGRFYCALVAIPVSVAAYLLAWAVQRPGRLAALAILGLVVWLAVGR
jgi:hypothetical protein